MDVAVNVLVLVPLRRRGLHREVIDNFTLFIQRFIQVGGVMVHVRECITALSLPRGALLIREVEYVLVRLFLFLLS